MATTHESKKCSIGSSPICVNVKRNILHASKKGKTKVIQYLVFEFYNRIDTSGVGTIIFNDVSKEDVMKLANNLKVLAESFE